MRTTLLSVLLPVASAIAACSSSETELQQANVVDDVDATRLGAASSALTTAAQCNAPLEPGTVQCPTMPITSAEPEVNWLFQGFGADTQLLCSILSCKCEFKDETGNLATPACKGYIKGADNKDSMCEYESVIVSMPRDMGHYPFPERDETKAVEFCKGKYKQACVDECRKQPERKPKSEKLACCVDPKRAVEVTLEAVTTAF